MRYSGGKSEVRIELVPFQCFHLVKNGKVTRSFGFLRSPTAGPSLTRTDFESADQDLTRPSVRIRIRTCGWTSTLYQRCTIMKMKEINCLRDSDRHGTLLKHQTCAEVCGRSKDISSGCLFPFSYFFNNSFSTLLPFTLGVPFSLLTAHSVHKIWSRRPPPAASASRCARQGPTQKPFLFFKSQMTTNRKMVNSSNSGFCSLSVGRTGRRNKGRPILDLRFFAPLAEDSLEGKVPHTTYITSTDPSHILSNNNQATAIMSSSQHVNVAMMTSGGLAPCLSSSVAALTQHWVAACRAGKIAGLTLRFYRDGYKGMLQGDSFVLPEDQWDSVAPLHDLGGSPIGNSRVKLTNIADCVKRGLCKEGESPLEVASQQLLQDEVNVIHTIGGDDTNTQAAELSKYLLEKHNGKVIVVGMPKTIDNDVFPIHQTFGADTAAKQGAIFFENVVSESTANPRMLILHEVMGRDCGYLTAATAKYYRDNLKAKTFVGPFTTTAASRDIHAIWIPELPIDIAGEGARLSKVMDEQGCVNVFLSEGSGVKDIVAELEKAGEEVPRDAFGHVKLDKVNPGAYFAKHLAELVKAEKTLVQKSGYFARSAAANEFDKELINKCAEVGVASAIEGTSGCMGQDEDKEGMPIRAIEFERIKGHKPFNTEQAWFKDMLADIGQI